MSVAQAEAREVQLEAPSGLWSEAWRRLRQNRAAIVGFVLVGIFLVAALFAPLIAPEDPRGAGVDDLLQRRGPACCPGPSAEHWFGLDEQGRDVFSRVVYGARFSLLIGIVATAVGLDRRGLRRHRRLLRRLGRLGDHATDRHHALDPGLLLAIGIVAALGQGIWQIMIAVGVTQIPIFARLLRGSILATREADYVLAARSVGVPGRALLGAHIIPNSVSPVIVQGTLALATAIIDVAALGFLGLGPPDPATPEWGTMLTNTTRYLQTAPPRTDPGLGDRDLRARLQPDRGGPRGARPEVPGQGMRQALLSVEDLEVRFWTGRGIIHAVNGVSFDIAPGETLGIVGESGCGKSVTSLALLDPAASRPGHERHSAFRRPEPDRALRRGAPDDPWQGHRDDLPDPMTSLNPVLTIGRQVREALETHFDMDKKEAEARAGELLDRVGIPSAKMRLKDYPHQFSGGCASGR